MESYCFTIRRIDGAWRVLAHVESDGIELTHFKPFGSEDGAECFLDRVREALSGGRDLNLAHWGSARSRVLRWGPPARLQLDERERYENPPRPAGCGCRSCELGLGEGLLTEGEKRNRRHHVHR